MVRSPLLLTDNQNRLLILRGTAIAATTFMSLAARPVFYVLPNMAVLLTLCALWGVFALLIHALGRRTDLVSPTRLFPTLLADIAFLTAWLTWCGGTANPLTALYLLPVAAAGALLPALWAWACALGSITAYSALWFIAQPLTVEDVDRAMQMHLTGMWLSFALAATLLAGSIAGMGSALRERDRRLAAVRERALRNERMGALGSLATGAAHALGTPLNTVTLLADEIAQAAPVGSELAEDAQELKRQADRCHQILRTLLADAGVREAGTERESLSAWLGKLVHDFRQRRPETAPRLTIATDIAERPLMADPVLRQAIDILLDNAADARSEGIECSMTLVRGQLHLSVTDQGPGFSESALLHIGREPYSEKSHGMGLGLYLAHAAAQRLGGRLEFANRARGATVTLSLPASLLEP